MTWHFNGRQGRARTERGMAQRLDPALALQSDVSPRDEGMLPGREETASSRRRTMPREASLAVKECAAVARPDPVRHTGGPTEDFPIGEHSLEHMRPAKRSTPRDSGDAGDHDGRWRKWQAGQGERKFRDLSDGPSEVTGGISVTPRRYAGDSPETCRRPCAGELAVDLVRVLRVRFHGSSQANGWIEIR